MTLTQDEKRDLTQYAIEKSTKAFETASRDFDYQDYDSCMNRLYYSSFYGIKALLYAHGDDYDLNSHKSVLNALSKHFIKAGLIDEELSAKIRNVEKMRNIADYEFDIEKRITSEQCELTLPLVRIFLDTCSELIEKLKEVRK